MAEAAAKGDVLEGQESDLADAAAHATLNLINGMINSSFDQLVDGDASPIVTGAMYGFLQAYHQLLNLGNGTLDEMRKETIRIVDHYIEQERKQLN